MLSQDDLKRAVARAALEFVPAGAVIGVGTGSTVDCFIDALGQAGIRLAGAVSSSERSAARLRALGLIYEGVLEPPKGELPDDWEPTEMTLFRATLFGDDSDRYVRISYLQPLPRIEEALERMRRFLQR